MAHNAPLYKVEPSTVDSGLGHGTLSSLLSANKDAIGKSGLTGLLHTAGYISPDQDPLSITHAQGKRRKFMGVKTEVPTSATRSQSSPQSLQQNLDVQYPSSTTDGAVKLSIVSQPEQQHRARYQTEGSRGAIKDRGGSSFPTVKLDGYSSQAKVEIYIGNDSGKVTPHMFYQACRVTGKNSYPCEEKKINGTDVIEVTLESGLEKLLVCDCVGILKERFADVEARFPKHKNWKTTKKKSTKCRLVFRVRVTNGRGDEEILQIASSVINCTQLPGLPEIQRMSSLTSTVKGGGELWIIGKNFLKETTVVFSYSVKEKLEPLWTERCKPDKDFLHQVHLITKIPPFVNQDISSEVEVSVYVECGDKQSDSHTFTYTPLATPLSNQAANLTPIELPKGVAAPAAVAINENYAKSRAVTLLHNTSDSPAVRRTSDDRGVVLPSSEDLSSVVHPSPSPESFLHNHKNKKRCLDYQGNKLTAHARRTRSVPRPKTISGPSLLNEDTVFVSGADTMDTKFHVTSFSQAVPWKGTVSPAKATPGTSASTTTTSAAGGSFDSAAARKQASFDNTTSPQQHKISFGHSETTQASDMNDLDNIDIQAKPEFALLTKRSFSNDDDESHLTPTVFPDDNSSICEESSSAKSDFSSNLTTDFSNVFSLMREKTSGGASSVSAPSQSSQAFSNFSEFQTQQSLNQQQAVGTNLEFGYQPKVEYPPQPKIEFTQTSPAMTTWAQEGIVKERSEEKEVIPETSSMTTFTESSNLGGSSVSVKATDEDKATISIKLPTSILKDQKHFQNVINTINNTLLRSPDEVAVQQQEQEPQQPPPQLGISKPDMTQLPPDEGGLTSSPRLNLSPSGKVTSVPVSVLTSKTRKRNFSKDAGVGGGAGAATAIEPLAAQPWQHPPPEASIDPLSVTRKDSMDWEAPDRNKKVQPETAMDWSANTAAANQAATSQNWTEFESAIKLQPLEDVEASKGGVAVVDASKSKGLEFVNSAMGTSTNYNLSSGSKPFTYEQGEESAGAAQIYACKTTGGDVIMAQQSEKTFPIDPLVTPSYVKPAVSQPGQNGFYVDKAGTGSGADTSTELFTASKQQTVFPSEPQVLPSQGFSAPPPFSAETRATTLDPAAAFSSVQPVTTFTTQQKDIVVAFSTQSSSTPVFTSQQPASVYTSSGPAKAPAVLYTSCTQSSSYTSQPTTAAYTSQPSTQVFTVGGSAFSQFVEVVSTTSAANLSQVAGGQAFQSVTTSSDGTKEPVPVYSLSSTPLTSNTAPQQEKTLFSGQSNQILQPVLEESSQFQVTGSPANIDSFSVQSTPSSYIHSPASVTPSTFVQSPPCGTPSTYVQSPPNQNSPQSLLVQSTPCSTVSAFVQTSPSAISSVSSYVQNQPSATPSSLVPSSTQPVTPLFTAEVAQPPANPVTQLLSFENGAVQQNLGGQPSLTVLPGEAIGQEVAPVIEQADYNMTSAPPLQAPGKDETLSLQAFGTVQAVVSEAGLTTTSHYGDVAATALNPTGIFGTTADATGISSNAFVEKPEAANQTSFGTATINSQQQTSSVPTLDNIQSSKSLSAMDYEMNDDVATYQKVSASEMAMYEDPTAIQGDPLLSETSAVIDVQKDIENAGNVESYTAQSQSSAEAIISMEGQEWKTTETSNDTLQPWGQ